MPVNTTATAPWAYALLTALALLSATVPTAQAQMAPDAGRAMQQQQTVPEAPVQRVLNLQIPRLLDKVAPGGTTVTITHLRFSGNSQLSADRLLASLPADALARPLDFSGLQGLAQQLSETYRQAGYPFARVFVPQQNLQSGSLLLQVVEGRYGEVITQGDERLRMAVQPYLAGLKSSEPIRQGPLERAVLLLGDLPGLKVSPLMRPGQNVGTGDLLVEVLAGPAISGEVGLDNHGNRFNGEYRLRTYLQYDSPFMVGDQLQIRLLGTDEKMVVGSLAYSAPLGSDGLRAQSSLAHTDYQLGKEFAPLEARGRADVLSAGLSYPLLRSQAVNLNLSVQWQYKRLEDRQDAVTFSTRKSSNSLPITLGFDRRDDVLGGGINFGALSYTPGWLMLDDNLRATDLDTAQTEGRFHRINLDLARTQSLPLPGLSLHARLSVQHAGGKNLDSSEGFGLGGASGVRAYPVGEGFGDGGWVSQVELRYSVGPLAPFVFYDAGRVTVNASPWTAEDNNRSLAGAGLGLHYQRGPLSADLAFAWRTRGGMPEADNQVRHPRAWGSLAYRF